MGILYNENFLVMNKWSIGTIDISDYFNMWRPLQLGENMMMLSDFVFVLLKEWQVDDLPVNILIGDMYYDIEKFFFDESIHEYILKLSRGSDYDTRADIVDPKNMESE